MAKVEPLDAFVLVAKRRTYKSEDKRPTVRTSRETYDTLVQLAAKSGLSITDLVDQAVRYAVDHLVWAEED